MKRILTIASLLLTLTLSAAAEGLDRPKLVVGIVVDQMKWDYLYYYYDDFQKDGLRRLVDDGFSYEQTMIPYVPTVTAIGHTSIYTGTTPALHGICGNSFFIGNKEVYCCGDSTAKTVGSKTNKGELSPRLMLSTTIGDQLKIATDYRSKVVGVAMKDRAAILPAGHAADGAYWWDSKEGHFITSSFYMEQLPRWVKDFNGKKCNTKECRNEGFMGTDDAVTMTFDMACAAIDGEQLGQRGETDMLCISISSTDLIGHGTSTRGEAISSVYRRLDRDIATFLSFLDEKVGRGDYLLFLSADHGSAHNFNQLNSHRIPAGAWESWKQVPPLRKYLSEQFKTERSLVLGEVSYRFFLDHEAIAAEGLSLAEVKRVAMEWLRNQPELEFVVDFADAQNATLPPMIRERLCRSYFPGRTGDIAVITHPQYYITSNKKDNNGCNHGAWNPYDSHIPWLMFGWKVKQGATVTPTAMTDIAPTICAMLHIEQPNACIGTARGECIDR